MGALRLEHQEKLARRASVPSGAATADASRACSAQRTTRQPRLASKTRGRKSAAPLRALGGRGAAEPRHRGSLVASVRFDEPAGRRLRAAILVPVLPAKVEIL